MNIAITGVGPRTGTSFVMRRLYEEGLPVFWNKDINIEGAEFETLPTELTGLENKIVKLWPGCFDHLPLDRMVLLRRDRETQLVSMYQQQEREEKQGYSIPFTPEELLDRCEEIVRISKLPKVLEVRTEDLDERIDEIIEFVKEGMKWH